MKNLGLFKSRLDGILYSKGKYIMALDSDDLFVNQNNNFIDNKTELNFVDVISGFKGDMKILQSISTLFYAFACHVGVFPVLNSETSKLSNFSSPKNIEAISLALLVLNVDTSKDVSEAQS